MTSFRRELKSLTTCLLHFDADRKQQKSTCLTYLSKLPLPSGAELVLYYDALLFLCAYPSDAQELKRTRNEIQRVTRHLKSIQKKTLGIFDNTGMPYMETTTKYSHDCLRWLLQDSQIEVHLEHLDPSPITLNDVLKITLPTLEKSETTPELRQYELLDTLKVHPKNRLPFLVDELSRLESQPLIKDFLFDHLELYVRIKPRDAAFSKASNCFSNDKIYYHQDILKSFDTPEILSRPLPTYTLLTDTEKKEAIRVVKNAMVLTTRETDPTTYMMESSFRLYELDRGIAVAIYDMVPDRQLPLESYVGYTAFKNGFPTAYGGAWVFGKRANFGINIFESYRGGESAYIMTQLLRVYKQVFGLTYFEVEPYQFGLDNPEGIASGAFWFYYRLGFRPLDTQLNAIAKKEAEKIKAKKGYRTSPSILKSFTKSPIGLILEKSKSPKVVDITSKVTRMIHKQYDDNRTLAEAKAIESFISNSTLPQHLSFAEKQVLKEVALWAASMEVKDLHAISLLEDMVRYKPIEVYTYQEAVRTYLSQYYE